MLACTEINNIKLFKDANISKKNVHSDNAKYLTTVWRNTVYLYIDHKPTVTSSHSANNDLFTLSVTVHNLYV